MSMAESRVLEYVRSFGEAEGGPGLPDSARACEWMIENVPFFECPDGDIERSYYFRWWIYRKHLEPTNDGYIVTEFRSPVPWAGKHNAISAAVGHHLYEGRWLRRAPDYLDDYIRFWLKADSGLLSYSSWFADAVLRYCEVAGRMELGVEVLDALAAIYRAREGTNLHRSGLFWSRDDRDAMECSISGDGLRPTLNSYAFGDARAISRIARLARRSSLADEFGEKAERLRSLFLERLWDESDGFFKTVPLASREGEPESWDFSRIDPSHNAREEIGYIPWCFGLPDARKPEAARRAWRELSDPEGFAAPFGPTTAERRHPRFGYERSHECLWNGPSWPFATSQTLCAMAKAIREYPEGVVQRAEYWRTLSSYAASQRRRMPDGGTVCWIDEDLDPFTGEWLARSKLESLGWPESKGGRERGRDYNHSTFCDLVISGLMGARLGEGGEPEASPLIPPGWNYAAVEDLPLNGRKLSIYYDRDGLRYGRGPGISTVGG